MSDGSFRDGSMAAGALSIAAPCLFSVVVLSHIGDLIWRVSSKKGTQVEDHVAEATVAVFRRAALGRSRSLTDKNDPK